MDLRLARAVPALWGPVLGSVALGLVSTGALVLQAVALGRLLAGAMPGATAPNRVALLCSLGGAILIRAAAAPAQTLLGARGAALVKGALRARLVEATLGTPNSNGDPGAVATLAGRGLDALDTYVGRCLPDLILAVVAPVALAAAVGLLDWLSGLIIVVAMLLFPIFGALVGRATATLAGERWSQVANLGTRVADVFEGMATLRAFGRTGDARRRLAEANQSLCRASLATLRVAFLSALVLDTLASVSVALVAVPLGLRLLHGSVGLPVALSVLVIAPEVFLPLRRASADFHESAEGLSALDQVFDALGTAPAGRPPAVRPSPDPVTTPVSLRHVTLQLPGRPEPVLRGANLVIGPGETVVIVGANGAGKSSLLSVILGFTPPTSGAIVVGDRDLVTVALEDWWRRLAYLPEKPSILRASLADNLRLGAPSAGATELAATLHELGAHDLAERLRDGAPLDPRTLSAGERQRIGIARVLVRRASLYLLDEPTAHLDHAAEAAVVAALGERLRARSAVIVTHRPGVLALADRVVTLQDGRLVEGPPVERRAPRPQRLEPVCTGSQT